jgi:hypothetical protein
MNRATSRPRPNRKEPCLRTMPSPQNFWEDLFAARAGEAGGVRVEMRNVSKHGRPLLLLPCQRRAAAVSLGLYPAQTPRARAAKLVLNWLLKAAAPFGTKRITFTVLSDDPFAGFLSSQAGQPGGGLPTLGVLAGNPASDGQRFLLLIFNDRQTPVAVVKAGLSERAKSLIKKEETFLAAIPENTSGVPRLRAAFQCPRLRALALDFFAGDSPRPRDEGALPALLASWVDPQRTVMVSDIPDWTRLESAASANELFGRIAGQLRSRPVHATIHHGDFAPWNIKVLPSGAWMVLDWERGELAGIPGWDWFHYVIQPAILVERLAAPELVRRIEALLGSEVFTSYAAHAGIAGCERALVLAYLLHAVEVIKPSEGLVATNDLLGAMAARWHRG